MGRRYRKVLKNIIKEFLLYKKGELIPNPEDIVGSFIVPAKLITVLKITVGIAYLSRKSTKHIFEKNKGVSLLKIIEYILNNYNDVYVSNHVDKNFSHRLSNRYILVALKNKSYFGLVIQINGIVKIITSMYVDINYIKRKYKKLNSND